MTMTAPQLFAACRGLTVRLGEQRCYYCGGACDGAIESASVVLKSFTARDTICGGAHVCDGCIAAMDEQADITLADGQQRAAQRVRCYSWVVGDHRAVAATKAHRAQLLSACLTPPAGEYVICLSDNGQKHLLYRAVVGRSRERVTVTLEGERVHYTPRELVERLSLIKKIIAATGKPALAEPLSYSAGMRIIDHTRDENLPDQWQAVRGEPLSRLAVWLAPAKEECANEYPACAAH